MIVLLTFYFDLWQDRCPPVEAALHTRTSPPALRCAAILYDVMLGMSDVTTAARDTDIVTHKTQHAPGFQIGDHLV